MGLIGLSSLWGKNKEAQKKALLHLGVYVFPKSNNLFSEVIFIKKNS